MAKVGCEEIETFIFEDLVNAEARFPLNAWE